MTTPRLIQPYQNRQLFLDDHAIERNYGFRRVLNKPDKLGPVIRPDRSKGQVSLQTADPPQWNSEKRLWEWFYGGGYSVPAYGRSRKTEKGATHYATSEDGISWDTSSLGLYEWNGSNENNIVVDPAGRRLTHILRDEVDPDPTRRYKALFTANQWMSRAPATSPDGLVWTMVDVPPIPSDDTSYLTYDEYTKQYLATVKLQTEWGRSVWLSSSPDFLMWTDPSLIIHSDQIDRHNRRRRISQQVEDPNLLTPPIVDDFSSGTNYNAEIYKMPIMPYQGLYIGFPVLFNPAGAIQQPWGNFTAINQVELAVSRDLYNWERVANRDVFIGVEPWDGETYDTMQLLTCGRPHVHEDREIHVYYTGIRFRGHKELFDEKYHEYFDDTSALCMAKLRIDGFVSLNADGNGTLLTRPFTLSGGSLFVNADATLGQIKASVIDAQSGEPLDGLSEEESVAVVSDNVRANLAWDNQPRLYHDRPVRIKFTANHAKLYSFWVQT